MTLNPWWPALFTVVIIVAYEVGLAMAEQRHPARVARSSHAQLRQEWFDAIAGEAGAEILAVQTLRNSLMSATMTASTAALGLAGLLRPLAGPVAAFLVVGTLLRFDSIGPDVHLPVQ